MTGPVLIRNNNLRKSVAWQVWAADRPYQNNMKIKNPELRRNMHCNIREICKKPTI
jgi:hypothetical protein